jgi:hypothetical protein
MFTTAKNNAAHAEANMVKANVRAVAAVGWAAGAGRTEATPS